MGGGCCHFNASQFRKVAAAHIRKRRLGNFSFEVHEGIFVGEGCKRTPGWITNKSQAYVEKKRSEFWDTRVTGSQKVWEILRAAIAEENTTRAEDLVESAGIYMPNGLLMIVYDSDGTRYDLPPYVINEPLEYGTFDSSPRLSELSIEKSVNLTFRHALKGDKRLSISNYSAVKELKEKYLGLMSLVGDTKLRLFYNGQELMDDNKLGNYEVKDNTVVQVLIG
mmetsp:Transcript_18184/g.32593  ORF Transcript_18184/g.32593 Transcript_18184/m.32593 type:complete len:223 (+) Transcript_18184:115-783(+)